MWGVYGFTSNGICPEDRALASDAQEPNPSQAPNRILERRAIDLGPVEELCDPNGASTEVAVTMNTAWSTSEGIMLRMACGSITVVLAPAFERPSERAAWN